MARETLKLEIKDLFELVNYINALNISISNIDESEFPVTTKSLRKLRDQLEEINNKLTSRNK